MNTFKHSGDLGDIVYAMPTIKALGGGIVYLNPGKKLPFPIHGIPTKKFTSEKPIDMIRPLLEAQPYIEKVLVWDGEEVTYDLDIFRNKGINLSNTNLAEAHCITFDVDKSVINQQWIFNVGRRRIANKNVVFHRSPRYHNPDFNTKYWPYYISRYGRDAVFVGTPEEYKEFISKFDCEYIHFHQVDNFLELAEIINGAVIFIGNQSMPYAVSEGLHHPSNILEVCINHPNCNFNRKRITQII